MRLADLLPVLVEKGGSDLHIKVGRPPRIRIMGMLKPLPMPELELSHEAIKHCLYEILNPQQIERFEHDRELDFSFQGEGGGRFRANYYYHLGTPGAAFRVIPARIPTLEGMSLPPVLAALTAHKQGIILVTGPTGSGKSTTLAAMIHHLNKTRAVHIVTIEDPVEFLHTEIQSQITQREIGSDTFSYPEAIRRALRQDPDVIMVGEMRDAESIGIAMTAAETGHLVLSTLHTNDARQSIDRILDAFPPHNQQQVRIQLATVMVATVAQRLLRRANGVGRVAAFEVMINTPTIRRLISDGKMEGISKAIEEGKTLYKMQSFNQHLLALIQDKTVTEEEALAFSSNQNDLKILIATHIQSGTRSQKPMVHIGTASMGEVFMGGKNEKQ